MKTKKKLQPRTKLILLQASGGIVTFAPLVIAVGVNFSDYFMTPASAVSFSAGGAMAIALVVLQMLGKAKKTLSSALVVSGIVFAFAVLLEPLILNIKLLTGMVLLGEGAYTVGFKGVIEREKKELEQTGQAQVLARALNEGKQNG